MTKIEMTTLTIGYVLAASLGFILAIGTGAQLAGHPHQGSSAVLWSAR